MDEFDFNITIVGLGLIGGSFAKALKKLNPKNIWAVDINKDILEEAQKIDIINGGYLDPSIPLKNSDIVIMCIYPNKAISFIKENMDNFKKNALITDVSGIKEKLVKEINTFLRDDIDYIGGHPMAGREYKGFTFSTKDIFIDANYFLTPTNKNKKENIELLEKIIKKIGCKNIVKLTPKKHDEIIAYTSQLPHIMAAALMNGIEEDNVHLFVAGSFRDATRVARMNEKLWTELFMDNRDNTIAQIESFQEQIENIKNSIINMDHDYLENIFKKTRIKREEFVRNCKK